jgi:hypothetical protein
MTERTDLHLDTLRLNKKTSQTEGLFVSLESDSVGFLNLVVFLMEKRGQFLKFSLKPVLRVPWQVEGIPADCRLEFLKLAENIFFG